MKLPRAAHESLIGAVAAAFAVPRGATSKRRPRGAALRMLTHLMPGGLEPWHRGARDRCGTCRRGRSWLVSDGHGGAERSADSRHGEVVPITKHDLLLASAGLVCRSAVVSLVHLRLAQGEGFDTPGSDWRADLRQVQAMRDVQGNLPAAPVLAVAVEQLHRRASRPAHRPDPSLRQAY